MKTSLSLFLFLIIGQVLFAQDPYGERRTELGFSVTSLIRRVPLFPSDDIVNGEYAVILKRPRRKSDKYHRFTIAGAVGGREFDNSILQFGYGVEKRRNIFEKWNFSNGIDFSIFIQDESRELTSGIGFSPFFGIHFMLNNRLYLAAESNIYAAFSTGVISGFSFAIRPLSSLSINFRM